MANEKSQKILKKFECENCDYICCSKKDFAKHLGTRKHQTTNNTKDKSQKIPNLYICWTCNNEYKHQSSLCKHKKTCNNTILDPTEILDDDNKIISLILDVVKNNNELQKQNQDFQQQMMETFQEVCKNNTTSINTGTINSHNKTFNLNVFLNEQCKDAMNIMDFVDSIKLDLSDAEMVGKLGYINGISHIIIKHLKALDVHLRPVHCTDLKRETLYVKYQDVWEKQGDDNKLIRKAIKHISSKNHNAAETFRKLHPDCLEYNSKHGNHFLNLRIEALGGSSGNDSYEGHSKIIKKIAKEVTIDKTL